MKSITSSLLALVLPLFLSAEAASAALDVGDKAPALSISEWVKGAPVDLAKDGPKRIHVVEFWAVWCPPCKMSIPLLTQLQQKYGKKLSIVGVTEPDFGRNSPAAIRDFVKSQGANMDYTVAIDTGRTTQSYMAAAGAVGIPHAFVIDKTGRVAWQGSPLDPAMASVLDDLVAGRFDLKAAKIAQQVNKRLEELNFLYQMEQWGRVWDGLIEILKLDPGNDVAMGALTRISVEQLGNADQFRDWVEGHIKKHRSNAVAMSRLADILCNINDLKSRLPDLALEAAKAAYSSSGKRDALVTTVYARALYQIGSLDRAIALQQDALALASDQDRKQIQGIFDFYRRCQALQQKAN